MAINYAEMIKKHRKNKREIIKKTKSIFAESIKKLENQERLLLDFIINCHDNVTMNDNNQFFFLVNLYSDALQSGSVTRKLILEGEYSAAGALMRNIFETMLLIEFLCKKQDNWKDWFEYQRINEDEKATSFKEKSSRLKKLIGKFAVSGFINNRSDIAVKENYRWTYAYLCSFPHTSMERLRRRTLGTDKGFLVYFTAQFNEDIAKYYLNTLFTLIDTIHSDFCVTFKPIKYPYLLKRYDSLKNK